MLGLLSPRMVRMEAPMLPRRALMRRCCTAVAPAFVLLATSAAAAQTWSDARTTPSLSELIAADATGEADWPFGSEDVAGDGTTFGAEEQSVDIRRAYAVTDTARLWLRAYVSSSGAPDASLRLYVFVDADGDNTTGGTAAAGDIEAAFTSDPPDGGYEHVLGLSGAGTVIDFWDYQAQQDNYLPNNGGATRAEADSGTDTDPLLLGGDVHGYVAGRIELGAAQRRVQFIVE